MSSLNRCTLPWELPLSRLLHTDQSIPFVMEPVV